MASILDLIARAGEGPHTRRCSRCGHAAEVVSEGLVAGTPPILESVLRCHACGIDTVCSIVACAVD
jgi:hypothetical protein